MTTTRSQEQEPPRIAIGQLAPDFELQDTTGKTIRLSDYRGVKHVVLALNRGFV